MVTRQPGNGTALNNLAWSLSQSDAASLPRAREFAERAFLLLPTAQTADTLGWIMARQGETAQATTLTRLAALATEASANPDRGIVYRYAATLRQAGQREDAERVLVTLLENPAAFPERTDADRLLVDLRAGR